MMQGIATVFQIVVLLLSATVAQPSSSSKAKRFDVLAGNPYISKLRTNDETANNNKARLDSKEKRTLEKDNDDVDDFSKTIRRFGKRNKIGSTSEGRQEGGIESGADGILGIRKRHVIRRKIITGRLKRDLRNRLTRLINQLELESRKKFSGKRINYKRSKPQMEHKHGNRSYNEKYYGGKPKSKHRNGNHKQKMNHRTHKNIQNDVKAHGTIQQYLRLSKKTVIKGKGKYRACVYSVPVPKRLPDRVTLHIKCKSIGGKRTVCGIPVYGQILTMAVKRRLAKHCCINHQTFGITRENNIWVSRGCWAEFTITVRECHHITRHIVDCRSTNKQKKECHVPGNGNILSIQILRRQSAARSCKYQRTFGPTINNNLWVKKDCSATFAVIAKRPSATLKYMFNCSSHRMQYRMCCVPGKGKIIHLTVIKQHSKIKCLYKRSYGHSKSNNIWVHRGCRAMFMIVKHLE